MSTEESGFPPEDMGPLFPAPVQPRNPGVRRFRKKPVVIEAWQLTEDNAVAVADWVSDHGVHCDQFPERLLITTLEGEMSAPLGWWVIRGVAGEFYPCAADVFAQTYEPVTDDPGESGAWVAARDRITEVNEARRDERERIRQLAIKHNAICPREPHTGIGVTTAGNAHVWMPGSDLPPIILFADLLGPKDPQ
jgi:hypothetical protein